MRGHPSGTNSRCFPARGQVPDASLSPVSVCSAGSVQGRRRALSHRRPQAQPGAQPSPLASSCLRAAETHVLVWVRGPTRGQLGVGEPPASRQPYLVQVGKELHPGPVLGVHSREASPSVSGVACGRGVRSPPHLECRPLLGPGTGDTGGRAPRQRKSRVPWVRASTSPPWPVRSRSPAAASSLWGAATGVSPGRGRDAASGRRWPRAAATWPKDRSPCRWRLPAPPQSHSRWGLARLPPSPAVPSFRGACCVAGVTVVLRVVPDGDAREPGRALRLRHGAASPGLPAAPADPPCRAAGTAPRPHHVRGPVPVAPGGVFPACSLVAAS